MLWLSSWSIHAVHYIKLAWLYIRPVLEILPFVAQSAGNCLKKNPGIKLAAFSLHKAVYLFPNSKQECISSYTT